MTTPQRSTCVECGRTITGRWIECDVCRHVTDAKCVVDRFWDQNAYKQVAAMIRGFAGDVKGRQMQALADNKGITASLCAAIRRGAESAKIDSEYMARLLADRLESDVRNLAVMEDKFSKVGGWRKRAEQAVAAISRDFKEAMKQNKI